MMFSLLTAMPWHAQMVDSALTLGLLVTSLGMCLCLYRLLAGPHISDRALALDTLGIHLIALVVLLSLKFHTTIYFDGILVLSLVGFAGGVAMAQYIGRPHLRKRPRPQPLTDANDPAAPDSRS